MFVKYHNPRTNELNYNSARTFDDAFAFHVDERPAQRASHRLVIIADDLAHIVNAKNHVVVELRMCTFDPATRAYYFRNMRQNERKL